MNLELIKQSTKLQLCWLISSAIYALLSLFLAYPYNDPEEGAILLIGGLVLLSLPISLIAIIPAVLVGAIASRAIDNFIGLLVLLIVFNGAGYYQWYILLPGIAKRRREKKRKQEEKKT